MSRTDAHPSLCSHHARQERRQKNDDPQTLALDLLGPVDHFYTATSINHIIGKILVLLACDRIPPRKAAVLAYLCQLLLQSLRGVQSELCGLSPELADALKQILKAVPQGNPTPPVVPPVYTANSASMFPVVPPANPAISESVRP